MAFVAQCLVTVALFDQEIEALLVLFLMILIGALLDMPLFYAGMLLVFVALTFLKRSATLLRTAEVLRLLSGIEQKDNPRNRWIHLVGPLASFMIFVGVATVIIEIAEVYPAAVTDAYNTVQDFSDPKHVEGESLNSEQRSIVERYSSTYPKIQFLSLEGLLREKCVEARCCQNRSET